MRNLAGICILAPGMPALGADLTGRTLLVTCVRTGDTEVLIADPTSGDLFNSSRSTAPC
jgi:hypothetical protein